jgi:MFS family permease
MMTESPGFSFASYHATNAHGFSPAAVSALLVDREHRRLRRLDPRRPSPGSLRRRLVAAIGFAAGGAGPAVFYTTPALLPAIAVMILGNATGMAVLYSYATELFPTHLRATARAWIGYLGVLGATAGLGLVGMLTDLAGGAAGVLTALATGNLVAAVILVAFLPETSPHLTRSKPDLTRAVDARSSNSR